MRIGEGKDYIKLEPLSRGGKSDPRRDFEFRIKVRLGDFHGTRDGVWFDDEELRRFTRALEELERTRSGSVTLSAMSDDEFRFTLRSIDRVGHFEIEVALRDSRFVGETCYPTRLTGVIPFSAEYFLALVRDFRKLFKNFP